MLGSFRQLCASTLYQVRESRTTNKFVFRRRCHPNWTSLSKMRKATMSRTRMTKATRRRRRRIPKKSPKRTTATAMSERRTRNKNMYTFLCLPIPNINSKVILMKICANVIDDAKNIEFYSSTFSKLYIQIISIRKL